MKSLIFACSLRSLFLGAAHPALAQTRRACRCDLGAGRSVGSGRDPVGVGKIYAQLRAQIATDVRKKDAEHLVRSGRLQKLDVYEPSTAVTKAPVLIFIHGGAFIGGSKNSYDNIGYYFARTAW